MQDGARLPRTSRVNEKIIEYYTKFGKERDLEKFMRLYSPSRCHSRSTTTTTTNSSNNSDEDGCVLRRLFCQETERSTECNNSGEKHTGKVHQIPIRLEGSMENKNNVDEMQGQILKVDNPVTPPKTQSTESKQTQTPESLTKSHKRLEWDSLGDVGYKKSMSTSNISILERSVLKEYFQETSRLVSNASEGDLKQLQKQQQQEEEQRRHREQSENSKKSSKATTEQSNKYNTPPLASSTMMDTVSRISGARPKYVSQGTSTSLQKQFEKCAQTSMPRELQMMSREVQVTLSSASGASSALGGSATPSSFDYYSSRSSHSGTTNTANEPASSKGGEKLQSSRQGEPQQPHPFVVGLTEMLASRKALATRNERVQTQQLKREANELQQLHKTLQKVLKENKENSVASTLLRSPQLDLGVQLLCSLIEARSLDKRQKKKLVRDIVKRISRLNAGADTQEDEKSSFNLTPNTASLGNDGTTENKSVKSTAKSGATVNMARTDERRNSKDSMDMQKLAQELPAVQSEVEQTNRGSLERLKQTDSDASAKSSPPTTSAKALERRKQSLKSKDRQVSKLAIENDTNNTTDSIGKPMSEPLTSTIETGTTHATSPAAHSHSTSISSSSREVITQKASATNPTNQSDTDAEACCQSNMCEWLNPITQSEIEYEEKKRQFKKNACIREKLLKNLDESKTLTERITQLQWIEQEIQRLESLRNLLLKPDMKNESNESELKPDSTSQLPTGEKIYDSVCSEQSSSQLSASAERIVQEIEVIIEESNEDVVNLADKMKKTKQRKCETQTVYERPKTEEGPSEYEKLTKGKPRFRTITETVVTNVEQVSPQTSTNDAQPARPSVATPNTNVSVPPTSPPPPPPPPPLQRSKLQTPPMSNDSGSVGSFVQQRKREFMEQYCNRKRSHYESLLHQQQQLLIQQQQQIITQLQQQQQQQNQLPPMMPTLNGHYSVPQAMGRCYQAPPPPQQQPPPHYYQPYFQHYSQPQPPAASTQPRSSATAGATATTTQYESKRTTVKTRYSSSAGLTSDHKQRENPTSSSSMFCMSSEVSVPMGCNDTGSSTSTTTHQYDDVTTGGVAGKCVQTGDSLQRSRTKFCCRCTNWNQWNRTPAQPQMPNRCICVQAKPKAIAYVIQFDKSTTSGESSESRKLTGSGTNITRAPAAAEEATSKLGSKTTITTTSTTTTTTISTIESEQARPAPPPQLTLQEYLERARPEFLAQSKERKAILNRIQSLRQERERELRDIVDNASISSLENRLQNLPPPPIKNLRIFPTKQMKAMTNRRFEKLPEVVEKQQREYEEKRRRGNRLLRDVFNKRLQRRVRSGKLSLNHSRQLI